MASMENTMMALTGKAVSVPGGGEDWKARAEAAERELQTQRVEAGRLRKANEELEAARARIAELEGSRVLQSAIADIPEEVGGEVPDGFKETSAIIAKRTVDQANKSIEERMERLERRDAEDAQTAFANRVNSAYPGFLDGIGPGGKIHDAWQEYLKHNSESVNAAAERFDFDTLEYHIKSFYRSGIEVPNPEAWQGGSAVPDPSSNAGGAFGGSVTMSPTKVYTYAEIDALYDRIEECRSRGDFKEMNRIDSEIKRAQAEGRIK